MRIKLFEGCLPIPDRFSESAMIYPEIRKLDSCPDCYASDQITHPKHVVLFVCQHADNMSKRTKGGMNMVDQ